MSMVLVHLGQSAGILKIGKKLGCYGTLNITNGGMVSSGDNSYVGAMIQVPQGAVTVDGSGFCLD